ncbi:HisA/HisF-related TIM barrel protein [Candidatus Pelagibacter ubique]|nr:HisA/HisF-related TIM barrel protein [Candidatus Pelagibacter ubique]
MKKKNKRIIFALLYSDGFYHLSRNFRLQRVGDYQWLEKTYDFKNNCENIDELAFLLVKRNPDKDDILKFLNEIEKIRKNIFAPIIIGGGIRNISDAKQYFDNGADKILINSKSLDNNLINEVSSLYGDQSITINIDYRYDSVNNENMTLINCGQTQTNLSLINHLKKIYNKNIGEIIFHSINRDGTGNGLDMKTINDISLSINKPILLMGGAGKTDHIIEALKHEKISGIITANIFNFMGNALKETREKAFEKKINIARLY